MYSAIDTTLNAFLLDPETYKEVSRLLSVEIESGLVNNERSSLKMLNSFVTDLPNGSETGSFLALDLGGTNFRVMLIDIDGNAYKSTSNIYYIPESVKIGNSIKMFDLIADSIQDFMIKYNLMDKHMRLGFTFSFPLLQTSLSTGKLISWTKGYKIDDAVGNCINQLLTDAIHRKNLNVSICAILNDTVGTLMTTAFEYHNAKIGVVIGTGTNMCYVEKICNYKKWVNRDSTENSKYVIVNSEWGAFGDNGVLEFILTEFDKVIDENSLNPLKQKYEKMISGLYLGELLRLILVKLINNKLILKGKLSVIMATIGNIETITLSIISLGKIDSVMKVFQDLGYNECDISNEDVNIITKICDVICKRAAYLTGTGIATIINRIDCDEMTVGITGSLYRYHPFFKKYLIEGINLIKKPNKKFYLHLTCDGSGIGAAIVAALGSKNTIEC